ncbi:MAG: 3-oxoadipate enol-lactonase, partial [Micromonosporaceae bacterium]
YDVHGPLDAPAVVLGGSLGTTRAMWDEQLPALAGEFRVIRYDHRGHGESHVPPGPYTMAELAGDLLAVLDELRIARAHLVGLSLGGMVAMQVAATYPERVGRLALICTAARLGPARSWLERATTARARGAAAIADAVTQRWFTPAFASSERAAELRASLRTTPPEGYAGCCEAIATMDLRPLLGAIRAPTLVVAGADDPATPPRLGQDIVDGVVRGGGSAHLQVVAGMAHLGSVERAGPVSELLLRHLEPTTEGAARG